MLFFLLVASVIVLEVLFRGWLFLSNQPQRPSLIRVEIMDLMGILSESFSPSESANQEVSHEGSNEKVILHPFSGYDFLHRLEQITREIDYNRSANHPNDYTILVLGGSVARRFWILSQKSFIHRLQQEDSRFQGKKIRILCHACSAYKQPQQATTAAYLLSIGYKPDAIINIDGFNEVALGFSNAKNRVFPLYPNLTAWGYLTRSGGVGPEALDLMLTIRDKQKSAWRTGNTALKYGFHFSGILGSLTQAQLRRIKTDYVNACQRYEALLTAPLQKHPGVTLRGPAFEDNESSVIDSIVNSWSEASVSIDSMCDVRSIHYLHVLQPTLHDKGSKSLTAEERRKGKAPPFWIVGVHAGYSRLREAGKELIARGVHFSDCSMVFHDVKETIYVDVCHFGHIGLEIFERAVAEAFLKSLNSK